MHGDFIAAVVGYQCPELARTNSKLWGTNTLHGFGFVLYIFI